MDKGFQQIAIVGAGLVGAGWAIVFARAGLSVRIYDERAAVRRSVLTSIRKSLEDMEQYDIVSEVASILANIEVVDTLAEAVATADYIQESVFERVDVKRAISHAIGSAMQPTAVVGSSTSGMPVSAFAEAAPHRERFIVAHPVNPPHLIPLVELVPAPWTDPSIPPVLSAFMEQIGQKPITVHHEIEGFVLNRLQGALLNEAWALFDAGIATAADIDRTVSDGLGLRWSFMGPFETIDLNAPGGIEDYARRLGPLYHSIALDRRDPKLWPDALIERAVAERRQALPVDSLAARTNWRDRRLMALSAHRTAEQRAEAPARENKPAV